MPGDGPALPPLKAATDRRLGSWKEIAAYLGRGVRSVQRWEREEGLPVHRLSHLKRGSVYAYKSELDEWWASRVGSLATMDPEEVETARQPEPDPRSPTARLAKSAIFAGIALAGVVLYLAIHRAPKGGPEMRQVTRSGAVRWPGISLSHDGKIVAFSSDAAEEGNLDIWVQETDGTQARRLTHAPELDFDPSISPDGTKVLFLSRRSSGSGIYQIAVSGGEEKLIIPDGAAPRFSPDGMRIAYLSLNRPRHLYVSDSDGGNIREAPIRPAEFDHPIWSPDGKYLMVHGRQGPAQPVDWWVINIGTQECFDTQVIRDLAPYFSSSSRWAFLPQAWLPGGRILFDADQDGKWSIWKIRLSDANFRLIGRPAPITERRPVNIPFAVAGNRLALVSILPDTQLWKLPVDTGRGKMTGSPRRITREGISQIPALSTDGVVLAYASSGSGTAGNDITEIRVRNIETGEEIVAASSPQRKGYTALSRDGSKIAYGVVATGLKRPIYIYDRKTRATRKLCDDCEGRPADWSPDGTKLLLAMPQKGVGLMDINTGERSVILPATSAVFSPDGRWLAVTTGAGAMDSSSHVYVVPFRGREKVPQDQWIAVGNQESHAIFPGWSPGGELLYYIAASHSNPRECVLEAQKFHSDAGQLEGQPFAVYHFDGPLLPLLMFPLINRLAIGPGQIVLASSGSKGDIWMTELDTRK
jgi:Tol biopolymer transport system component